MSIREGIVAVEISMVEAGVRLRCVHISLLSVILSLLVCILICADRPIRRVCVD